MVNSSLDLAKYIVTKCVNENCPISNLQLQKILYYIQEWSLKNTGEPIFPDDIEAWQFGPVVPKVYYYFCGFGAMPISSNYSNSMILENKPEIDSIIESKRILKPWDLVAETHRSGGAWDQIYNDGKGNRMIIPVELIREKN